MSDLIPYMSISDFEKTDFHHSSQKVGDYSYWVKLLNKNRDSFFLEISSAIEIVNVDEFFVCFDAESVTANPNTLRRYKRIAVAPFYFDMGDDYGMVSIADLKSAMSSVVPYYAFLVEGVEKTKVGNFFQAPDPESGNTRLYKKTAISPFYEDQGNEAAPVTQGLLASTAAGKGAALIGKSGDGTVQSHIDLWSTKNYGAIGAGTTADTVVSKTFSGHSGGTTDFRGLVYQTTLTGSNSIAEVDQVTAQLELTHSAGTLVSAFGHKAYARLGRLGSTTGNVTSIRVYDTHVANEGTGNIGVATCFFADGVDLIDGTGTIGDMIGFYAGNQSHATRVTSKAIGFNAGNMLAGAPLIAGFRSEMQAGTGKYGFLSEGNAVNQFRGPVGIGSASIPVDVLELFQGYAKLCGSTTKFATGNFHEMRTGNNGAEIAVLSHTGTSPLGIRIRMDQAANDATGYFVRCDSASGDMLFVRRNGNVVNQTNSYGAISNRFVKSDIQPIGSLMDDFARVQYRSYILNADPDGPHQYGVITDELSEVFPHLVSGEGAEQTANYAGLSVIVGAVVSELVVEVQNLKAQIAALSAGRRAQLPDQ